MKKSAVERFRYWFDKQVEKGTWVVLLMLAGALLLVVLLISLILYLAEGESFFLNFWDVFSTTINAWMPSSEDGELTYLILVSISAIIGLLFTSFVIGVVTSYVEERLSSLRKGNSVVLEEGHLVVLGFDASDYTLISQLIYAAGEEERCILVAADMDKEEMEQAIRDNLEIPRNVHLICRSADITNTFSLKCCSLETAKIVLVNPLDDTVTVKSLLAISKVLEENGYPDVHVVTAVLHNDYIFPYNIRNQYGLVMLRINDLIARIIAHSCEQPGLAEAFSEVFDFMGNELYIESVSDAAGRSFEEIVCRMNKGVPIGILRNGNTVLNPDKDTLLEAEDRLIIFETQAGAYELSETYDSSSEADDDSVCQPFGAGNVLIIGQNQKLEFIIEELPGKTKKIFFAGTENMDQLVQIGSSLRPEIKFEALEGDVMNLEVLRKMVNNAAHVIVLSDFDEEIEAADIRSIMLTLKLREIRILTEREFSLIVEMRKEENRKLLFDKDSTDFIVSSNLSSMILTQEALTPELYDTFHEILSNEGNEFVLLGAGQIGLAGKERTIAELRRKLLHRRCILLGYIDYEGREQKLHLNPKLNERVLLSNKDKLIVVEDEQ